MNYLFGIEKIKNLQIIKIDDKLFHQIDLKLGLDFELG
jgi:hypothetical protein